MSVVHEHVARFSERNVFLEMVVGLVSAARRVERLVAAAKREPAAESGEHPFDLFALGVISFSRRLLAHTSAAETCVEVTSSADDAPVRDLLL